MQVRVASGNDSHILLAKFLRSRPARIHGETDRERDSATTMAELKSGMKALTATVNEQTSELRKVKRATADQQRRCARDCEESVNCDAF
jgi:hypothetical protein